MDSSAHSKLRLLLLAIGTVYVKAALMEEGAVSEAVGAWRPEVGAMVGSLLTRAGLNRPECAIAVVAQRGQQRRIAERHFADFTLHEDSFLQTLLRGPQSATTARLSRLAAHLPSNSSLHSLALELKMTVWSVQCSGVVLLSDSVDAATRFSDAMLRHAVLKRHTKFFWVTSLELERFDGLLASHWIFAKMNAAVLSWSRSAAGTRTILHYHLPFSPSGPSTISLHSWDFPSHEILPDKYCNFNGGVVNVTALSFYPFWLEEETPEGTGPPQYRGTDFQMLSALGQALNFSFHVIPTQDWGEVLDKVTRYESFMASVMHYVYHHRLKSFHFTRVFDISSLAFSMKTPVISPKWESLVYPFSWQVWRALLLVLLLMPFPFTLFAYGATRMAGSSEASAERSLVGKLGWHFLQIWKILLGQNLPYNLPLTHSFRLLLLSWMSYAFLVTVTYKTNLIAHLTLPKAPFRPESLRDLVRTGAFITAPPYADALRLFFLNSEDAEYRTMGHRFKFVDSMEDGMELVRNFGSSAHVEDKIYLLFEVATSYTRPDGTSDLYIAREGLMPGYVAYPVPHNAPYLGHFNKWIGFILQAGLLGRWRQDELQFTLRKQRSKVCGALPSSQQEQATPSRAAGTRNAVVALTLVHLQGPLLLLVLGWVVGSVVLMVELLLGRFEMKQKL